jgi:hypothetical protein
MISNFHKNCMGTMSFDGKFPGMRKAQDFIVYPIKAGEVPKEIEIQSDTRFGAVELATGKVFMSKPHANGANGWHLALEGRGLSLCTLPAEELLLLKGHIMGTASAEAGKKENGIMQCDNSGAINIFGAN